MKRSKVEVKKAGRRGRRKSSNRPSSYLFQIITVLMVCLLLLYLVVVVRAVALLSEQQNKQNQQNHQLRGNENSLENNKSFPIKIKNNPHEYETIYHPGDAMVFTPKYVEMKVPKLWEPIGGRQGLGDDLMTPAIASSIGSKIVNENKMELETIFISVASYRDDQCSNTVADIFYRAKYPERVRVAVIDQIATEANDPPCLPSPEECQHNSDNLLCKHSSNIDAFDMDASMGVGPVFARHLGHRMYRGEYFAMQVDSHVSFVQDWDEDVVEQWKSANNEMAVLTVYLSDVQGSIDPNTGKSLHPDRPIMCESNFVAGPGSFLQHGQQPEGPPGIHGTPTLEPYWAAGFSFARGHFVVNVPYDQHLPMIFQGEEISMGIRAFSYGYDFYTPERATCFHMYAFGANKDKRSHVKLFWENSSRYAGVAKTSLLRLRNIIGLAKEDLEQNKSWYDQDAAKYGLGKVRDPEKFYKVYGVHVKEHKVEKHLCRFAGKRMHNLFIPALRKNGMGLDYDLIDYEFRDPERPKREPMIT